MTTQPIDLIACTIGDSAPVPPGNPLRFCDGLSAGFHGAADRQQADNADYPGTFRERARGGRIWLDRVCGLWPAPVQVGTGLNGQPGWCNMRPPIIIDGLDDFVSELAAEAASNNPGGYFLGLYVGSWAQGTSRAQMRNSLAWIKASGVTHVFGDVSGGLPRTHLQWSQWAPMLRDAGIVYGSEPTLPWARNTNHTVPFARVSLWGAACAAQNYPGPGDMGGENFAVVQLSAGPTTADRVAVVQQAQGAGWTPVVDPAGMNPTQRITIGLSNPVPVTP